jgi:hypothetical protein
MQKQGRQNNHKSNKELLNKRMSHENSFWADLRVLGSNVDIGEQYRCHKTLSTVRDKVDSIGGN